MTCGQVWWPILGICALHLTHPSAHTHTVVNTHTPWEQLGVICLAQGSHLSRGIEGGENARYSLPQFLPDPRFEPTTSGYTNLTLYPLGHDCPDCVCVCICVYIYIYIYIYIYTQTHRQTHTHTHTHTHTETDRQRDISLVRSSRSFLWLIIASRPSFSLMNCSAGPILAFLPY